MDIGLIFPNYRNSIKTDGGTQTVSLVAQWFQSQVKGVGFAHPADGSPMVFDSPLPADLHELFTDLERF